MKHDVIILSDSKKTLVYNAIPFRRQNLFSEVNHQIDPIFVSVFIT